MEKGSQEKTFFHLFINIITKQFDLHELTSLFMLVDENLNKP